MAQKKPTAPKTPEAVQWTQRHNGAFASGFASLPHDGTRKAGADTPDDTEAD